MNHRVELLIKLKNLTPAQFADELKVQRANVSHILNGRNKPSLDFVQRIIRRYPDVNIRWLLFGEGEILALSHQNNDKIDETKNEDKKDETTPLKPGAHVVAMKLFPDEDTSPDTESIPEAVKTEKIDIQEADLLEDIDKNQASETENKTGTEKSGTEKKQLSGTQSPNYSEYNPTQAGVNKAKDQKQVVKIIFFYSDRTFEIFLPEEK